MLRDDDSLVRSTMGLHLVDGERDKGRPKLTWDQVVLNGFGPVLGLRKTGMGLEVEMEKGTFRGCLLVR